MFQTGDAVIHNGTQWNIVTGPLGKNILYGLHALMTDEPHSAATPVRWTRKSPLRKYKNRQNNTMIRGTTNCTNRFHELVKTFRVENIRTTSQAFKKIMFSTYTYALGWFVVKYRAKMWEIEGTTQARWSLTIIFLQKTLKETRKATSFSQN